MQETDPKLRRELDKLDPQMRDLAESVLEKGEGLQAKLDAVHAGQSRNPLLVLYAIGSTPFMIMLVGLVFAIAGAYFASDLQDEPEASATLWLPTVIGVLVFTGGLAIAVTRYRRLRRPQS